MYRRLPRSGLVQSPLFCAQHNGLILERAEEVIAVLEKAGAKGSPAPVVPVRTGPPSIARAAAGLLQSSVDSFFAKSNCGAWHHQPVAAMAVKAAREAGVG